MIVVVSPEAQAELNAIWDWNANDRGEHHADRYIEFLTECIEGLSMDYTKGKLVGTRPDLRYIQMRRNSRGHGHVTVYTVMGNIITVVHVFHTAQDWQNKLAAE